MGRSQKIFECMPDEAYICMPIWWSIHSLLGSKSLCYISLFIWSDQQNPKSNGQSTYSWAAHFHKVFFSALVPSQKVWKMDRWIFFDVDRPRNNLDLILRNQSDLFFFSNQLLKILMSIALFNYSTTFQPHFFSKQLLQIFNYEEQMLYQKLLSV